jgi:pyruvate formate lyase activating enzyme
MDEDRVLDFLRTRTRFLDGVVISGGEPTLVPDLADYAKALKGMGYRVKLDTNGSNPALVADLIDRKLLDYVALDVKTDPARYPPELAAKDYSPQVRETINLLKKSPCPHEFRATAAWPFVTRESVRAIAKAVAGDAPLYLQVYKPDRVLNPESMFLTRDRQPSLEEMRAMKDIASASAPCYLR